MCICMERLAVLIFRHVPGKNVSGGVHLWHFVCDPRHRLPPCSALMPNLRDGGSVKKALMGKCKFGRMLPSCDLNGLRCRKRTARWRPSFYSPARVSLVPILPAGFQIPATRSYHTPHFRTTPSLSHHGLPSLNTPSYTHPPPPAPMNSSVNDDIFVAAILAAICSAFSALAPSNLT